jgi:hypothetical protein
VEGDVSLLSRWGLPWTECVSLPVSLFLLAALALPAQAVEADEYKIKGAFLYRFARFVEWPSQSQVGSDDEIRICVLGNDEVTSILSEMLEGRRAGSRDVMVRRLDDLADVAWCRIFFITKFAEMEPEYVFNSLGATSILTVGETAGFAANGGMVNFTGDRSKVRFEINQGAARRAGLKISSKLLRLAELVED